VRDVWCPASASTLVGWQAAIDFRVEPGSYPDGLTAIATVVAKGQLSKFGLCLSKIFEIHLHKRTAGGDVDIDG